MANDVAELQSRISNDLQRSDITNAEILNNIVSTVRNYETRRFYFNEAILGPVSISQTILYSLQMWAPGGTAGQPTDIIETDSVKVKVSNTRQYTLEGKGWIELDHIDAMSISTSGYPQYYSIYGNQIRFYPKPTSFSPKLQVTISAHVKYPDLANTTDVNCWTTEAKELIRAEVLRYFWAQRVRDYDAAEGAQQDADKALLALQRRTESMSSHRIRVHL